MTEIINRYHKGKIYKIVNDINDDIYIGSTIKQLSNRMGEHRSTLKKNQKRKVYKVMFELGIEHFRIILVEEYKCDNIDQLRAREDYFIQLMKPSLNTYSAILNEETYKERRRQYEIEYRKIPLTAEKIKQKKDYHQEYSKTDKFKNSCKLYRESHKNEVRELQSKYRETHKEEIKESQKEYYNDNKEKIALKNKAIIHCDLCNIDITYVYKSRHEKSLRHLNNL
jgi:group I intron endonuclease